MRHFARKFERNEYFAILAKVKDITWNLLFNWWKNLKLVQHAEFNIQFAK